MFMNASSIEQVSFYKYLGWYITSELNDDKDLLVRSVAIMLNATCYCATLGCVLLRLGRHYLSHTCVTCIVVLYGVHTPGAVTQN